jgi:ATP synthase I chain
MMDVFAHAMLQLPDSAEDQIADRFYSGAYSRIVRFMLVAGAAAAVAVFARWGAMVGVGFVLGCGIAVLNFYWLKRVVSALADKVTTSGTPQSSAGIVLRFLLRYFLIALGAYAIFEISTASLYGLLAGLFLPVAGIFCEAAYEGWVAVRRGM